MTSIKYRKKSLWILLVGFIIIAYCFFIPTHSQNHSSQFELDSNWKFYYKKSDQWFIAKVPGNVFTDLLENKIIEDPFYGTNESKFQWVSEEIWVYQNEFEIEKDLLKYDNLYLTFKGLDTYAKVYLNGQQILESENMFRSYSIDIKSFLRSGYNILKIEFQPILKIADSLYSSLPYKLPDDSRCMVRKAPYQFGWDWGPKLIGCGIWRPVVIEAWNDAKIENVQVVQDFLNDSAAFVTVNVEIQSDKVQNVKVSFFELDSSINVNEELEFKLEKGINKIPIKLHVENPKLWWSNGLGNSFLYHLNGIVEGKEFVDSFHTTFGLRNLELIQNPDSAGVSFYFKLNGISVFMKGANMIPLDVFPSRVSIEEVKDLILSAKNANMNMLRVWGGGIYENDEFYDLCDENGILVWQDFMFAGSMYPNNQDFIENIKQEAIYNVKRLRNHSCLALWCGNNEIDEAWHNWGWQKKFGYSEKDSTEIWENYLNIFQKILPDIVNSYDSGRIYWPSSPKIGWGNTESLKEGDAHYWGVWWGEEPFEVYENKVGRFMSEYGFQGMPDVKTFESFTTDNQLFVGSETLEAHQKHPRGTYLIKEYMQRDYKVPSDFEDYIYVSQVLQAGGITKAIEAHRRAKPYCMGTLYWQLNDCWPVTSWSSIDYYKQPKALHYQVKKAYDDVLISIVENENKIDVWVISDKLNPIEGHLEMSFYSTDGKFKLPFSKNIKIEANSSKIYHSFKKDDLIRLYFSKSYYILNTKLTIENNKTYESIRCFVKPKNLYLPKADIKVNFKPIENGYKIYLKSDVYAKSVYLEIHQNGKLSDNFFDLIPNQEKTIILETGQKNLSKNDLKIICLNHLN